MKKEEVPQDTDNLNEGKLAKLYYATDEKGHYEKLNSIGWEAETVVMRQAWDVVHENIEDAREKVLKGDASPVLFYKEQNIMTYEIIAGYVGTLSFIVWLHTKPFFFKRLSSKTLDKYAFAFRITREELMDITKFKDPRTGATENNNA
jgi:hypothetical protein